MRASYAAVWRNASTASADRRPSGIVAVLVEGGQDGVVARGRRHDRDRGVVLGRGADHRRPADVDLLDQLVEREAGLARGLRERIQVDDDELERCDPGRGEGLAVVRAPAVGEEAGVDPRMERLHAAVEHLGEAGDRGDVRDREPRLAQGPGGAPRC